MSEATPVTPDRTGCFVGRVDGWMETYTGIAFPVLEPDVSLIRISDIAHALSNVCRYGGHCRKHYSVAQHSVHVHDWLSADLDEELSFAGLLHDGSEAYIADIVRPVKPLLTEYAGIEHRLQSAVFAAFGLAPTPDGLARIKQADNALCRAEAEQLMSSGGRTWNWGDTAAARIRITPWSAEDAAEAFLATFHRYR